MLADFAFAALLFMLHLTKAFALAKKFLERTNRLHAQPVLYQCFQAVLSIIIRVEQLRHPQRIGDDVP